MNINQIMDSAYIIPVIFDHLQSPSDITRAILKENKISEKTVKQFKKVSALMEYHEKKTADYPLLQHGLKQYFKSNLSSVFRKLGLVAQDMVVLDYGAGTGVVSDQFKRDNPLAVRYLVDKTDYTNGNTMIRDFEQDPDWYLEHIDTFDLVILSEVLHCKDNDTQQYLIDSSRKMLKDHGKLVIIENIDHCMAWRISKIKNSYYPVVGPSRVSELTNGDFIMQKHIQLGKHIAYLYQKL